MTQKIINEIYRGEIGQQWTAYPMYSTSDDRVFLRHSEAELHTKGELDPDTKPLNDRTIIEWWDENPLNKKSMTQERINKYFKSEEGKKASFLYTTSDDRVFFRYSEAVQHTNGRYDPNSYPLDDKEIIHWCDTNDYSQEQK